jgi:hypothetical protein
MTSRTHKPALAFILMLALGAPATEAFSAKLQPATVEAWNKYYEWADQKVKRDMKDPDRFLIQDFLPAQQKAEIRKQLNSGRIVVHKVTGIVPAGVKFDVPEGEIHHWWGAILLPGVRMPELLRFLQDYDNHAGKFSDVEKSKLLARNGNFYRFFFRLKRTKAIVTAQYNSEQECVYVEKDPRRVWTRSIATKIAELENAGTAQEREKTPGEDRGYLWRLVSWWRMEETDSGVIVEIESASLSRDVPWIVNILPGVSSYIRSTPRESLESVLTSIKTHAPARGN